MHKDLRSKHLRRVTRKRIVVSKSPHRSGYSYVRKSKISRVRGVPAYDVGTIGKSKKVIGTLKHGMLTKFGYHPVEATTNRIKALMNAIAKGGEKPLAVFRRLIAISTLTKRTLPRASRIYKHDAKWVRSKYSLTSKKM